MDKLFPYPLSLPSFKSHVNPISTMQDEEKNQSPTDMNPIQNTKNLQRKNGEKIYPTKRRHARTHAPLRTRSHHRGEIVVRGQPKL
uniref:Uncharacterized protein n=1 Tax=Nelumbo nucifera TaxID=4432 RepID=A0A822Z189_NELNU|nr:TPA_asm: hypothetical protein HUJ06_005898 [Nelumbo nucifera]